MSRPVDLGPDPDAATRLSLNELAGMDCNRRGHCTQYRERCPFVDEPAFASAMTVWRRSQRGTGSHCVRSAGDRYTCREQV